MPTLPSVLATLKQKSSEKTQITYARHGMSPDRTLGVSVADLKLIAKTIKGDQPLALALYDTAFMEAMYLAGIIAAGSKMTPAHLQSWADAAHGLTMISEHTVPWVTVENTAGPTLAAKWIVSPKEHVACAGWCTWSGLVTTQPDATLDLKQIESLLAHIAAHIHTAPNRVRSTMNSFVIAVGSYVTPLFPQADAAATRIGPVFVDVGDTACEIPLATTYIAKARSRSQAKPAATLKRKTIRC